jgi:hypothetical protein
VFGLRDPFGPDTDQIAPDVSKSLLTPGTPFEVAPVIKCVHRSAVPARSVNLLLTTAREIPELGGVAQTGELLFDLFREAVRIVQELELLFFPLHCRALSRGNQGFQCLGIHLGGKM